MKKLVLEYLGSRTYRLREPFEYMGYTVPSGYITDGATIPRIFWSVVGSPFTGRYVKPAVLHDWLCTSKVVDFKTANKVFYKSMRKAGVNRFKARIMYLAVDIYTSYFLKC